jgi:hypothetical protein
MSIFNVKFLSKINFVEGNNEYKWDCPQCRSISCLKISILKIFCRRWVDHGNANQSYRNTVCDTKHVYSTQQISPVQFFFGIPTNCFNSVIPLLPFFSSCCHLKVIRFCWFLIYSWESKQSLDFISLY